MNQLYLNTNHVFIMYKKRRQHVMLHVSLGWLRINQFKIQIYML